MLYVTLFFSLDLPKSNDAGYCNGRVGNPIQDVQKLDDLMVAVGCPDAVTSTMWQVVESLFGYTVTCLRRELIFVNDKE